jgi:hypothetical protein
LISRILPSLCEELLFLLGASHSVTMKLLMLLGSEEDEGFEMATGTIPAVTTHVNKRRETVTAQRSIIENTVTRPLASVRKNMAGWVDKSNRCGVWCIYLLVSSCVVMRGTSMFSGKLIDIKNKASLRHWIRDILVNKMCRILPHDEGLVCRAGVACIKQDTRALPLIEMHEYVLLGTFSAKN